jgi:hypothetical protein
MWGKNVVHVTISYALGGRSLSVMRASTKSPNLATIYSSTLWPIRYKRMVAAKWESEMWALIVTAKNASSIGISGAPVIIPEQTRQIVVSIIVGKMKNQPAQWIAPNRQAMKDVGMATTSPLAPAPE